MPNIQSNTTDPRPFTGGPLFHATPSPPTYIIPPQTQKWPPPAFPIPPPGFPWYRGIPDFPPARSHHSMPGGDLTVSSVPVNPPTDNRYNVPGRAQPESSASLKHPHCQPSAGCAQQVSSVLRQLPDDSHPRSVPGSAKTSEHRSMYATGRRLSSPQTRKRPTGKERPLHVSVW
ncbi:hypothetical protein DPMN_089844 [Dreissena polymorpha]|uniref:Uncharacterized protein n=1 Tax=Dreissena polymorpha TaxID=45954 RepID=A0A9D4KXQ8_DREPO|nr:hypothetical protein DPMN_089844 [Dreissena polymorpha]